MADFKAHREQIAAADAEVIRIIAAHNPKILIIGIGQVGIDLVSALLKKSKLAGHISPVSAGNLVLADLGAGFERLKDLSVPAGVKKREVDITNLQQVKTLAESEKPDIVINLVAVLSTEMKNNPLRGYEINAFGAQNLMVSLTGRTDQPILFVPSTIAATGCKPEEREGAAAQNGVFDDTGTAYGRTKQVVETLMGTLARDVGIRSVGPRWPVIASAAKILGGGTTDYSVDIFRSALRGEKYICPIDENRMLPMMTGEDAVRTILYSIAQAAKTELADFRTRMKHSHRYNMPSISMTPAQLFGAMKVCLPEALQQIVSIEYKTDARDQIAAGWPAQSEGSAFCNDCRGFELANDNEQRFAANILASFARNPELLHKEGDDTAKTALIKANCKNVLTHLAREFGIPDDRTRG